MGGPGQSEVVRLQVSRMHEPKEIQVRRSFGVMDCQSDL